MLMSLVDQYLFRSSACYQKSALMNLLLFIVIILQILNSIEIRFLFNSTFLKHNKSRFYRNRLHCQNEFRVKIEYLNT